MEVYWFEQCAADVPAGNDWLSPAEAVTAAAMRIPKRRDDWRLGRWTAKCAIRAYLQPEALALPEVELRLAPSGAPVAFLTNTPASLTISLSHRGGRAMCALAPPNTRIGCDLEAIEARSEAFATDYFTENEQAITCHVAHEHRSAALTLMWSLKECVLKALQVGLREDTRSVEVSFPDLALLRVALSERAAGDSHATWYLAKANTSWGDSFMCCWQRDRHTLRTIAAPKLFHPIDLQAASTLLRRAASGAAC